MLIRILSTLTVLIGSTILGHAAEPLSIDALIEQLSADDYATREKASSDLKTLAKKAPEKHTPTVLNAYLTTQEPEAKQRLLAALYQLHIQTAYPKERGFLGIGHEVVRIPIGRELHTTILVQNLMPGKPAEKAGLQRGDFIIAVNHLDITKLPIQEAQKQFTETILNAGAFKKVSITYLRNNVKQKIEIVLSSFDEQFIDESQFKQNFEKWLQEKTKAHQEKTAQPAKLNQ